MNATTIKKFAMLTAGVLVTIYIVRQLPVIGTYADKALVG